MAEIKWIKIVTDIFDSQKIKQIEAMPEGDSIIIIWFKLLCLAGKINEDGSIYLTKDVPFTDDMLAVAFNRPLNTIKLALSLFQRFGMICIDENAICIANWDKYQNIEGMQKVREQTRRRVARHRENLKLQALEGCVTERYSSVTVTAQNKNKNKNKISTKVDNNICSNSAPKTMQNAEELFEKLWSMYPKKRGKGQVSASTKKKLLAIGEQAMVKAIERYKAEIKAKRTEEQYIKNGSTFFNSGYLDFLDDNFNAEKPEEDESGLVENMW